MPHCMEAAAAAEAAAWNWRSLEQAAMPPARALAASGGGGRRRCLASECNNHPTRETVFGVILL